MIQIKRNNSVIFTLEDFCEGSKLSYQLMDHHYVILKFTTATPVYFEIGDSVEIPDFGYFELTSAYFPKQNDSDGFDYELQMDAYYMSWKNKLCKYRPQHGANETSFKLTTTVGVHMNVILSNLKALGLTYKGHEFTVDYTTYNSKAFDVQKRFLVEYNSISIIDALNTICSEDALNCEWWVDGSIIYLGFCEMRGQTTFEQDVNVLSMSFSESKSTYITRLYAFGSDRNIPKGYFTGSDADVTTDGIATDYLMLPNKEVDSDGFYAKDGYIENVNVVKNEKQAIEGVVMFEDEYPKVSCTVSEVKTYDSTVDNEDGTKTTQTFWQVTSTDAFTTGFETSWVKSNLTLGIKFTSGALTGMEFDVEFKVIDNKKYYEVIANDTYGRTLPDSVMCPKVGDTFFLFNWDATKITDTDLIPTARLSLFGRAKQYYQKTMISNSNFTCTMDGEKFYNDGTYNYHPMGEQVKLINPMFAQVDSDGKHYRNSRIIGMEIALDIPYDHPQYIVGEKAATSRLGKLEDKVDSITVNGIQIGGTGSGNGGGVYVIGLNDFTPASDSNVYSARRSRMEFMSRINDDTAQNTITWEKVQKFIGGLLVGKYNSENGGSWSLDSVGRSHLVTDYLEVRMKAIFEELVIKKTSAIGGKEIISPAGGVKIHKVEVVSVTYNATEQKAYRCYFLAEQEGDAVDNDFAIDDQVRSESFNLKSGAYHKAGNHFYWRLVIGRDENPVELEGIRYHYIDLSDSDCATDSDIPAMGDTLSQCGNRSDIVRQNCLIFSSVDVYSPSVSLYHGINSYSFANKEYVEYGVNKQTDKAFFNVYGDLYIGDRPTKENGNEGASYIKFDSAKKQMEIKAKIDAKSTIGDKDIDKYIKDNTLSSDDVKNLINSSEIIGSLQNQIDGAIETWYYDGKPTLENLPAQGWTDDDTKKKHIGDLYYDKASGKGYRFLKDETGAYIWAIITDEDITKALALAGEKKRIFGRTPIPPYDVDDLWVYAIYPSDGSKYNKEILRCVTAKSAGENFSIDDWALASDYATNTKVAQLDYLKDALKNDTAINGGLILSTLIALRDKSKNIQSGINGAVQDAKYKGGGIAAWYGGEMGDIEDKSNYPGVTNWAKSLLRFDGSGYLANGNISWQTDGKVNIKDLHALINSTDTNVLNVLASIYNMFSTRVKESETLILPQLRFGALFIERLRQEDLDNNDVVLTQREIKDRFVTIDWFNKVFSVVDDKKSDLPVNGNISAGASIHAKMSLYSDGGLSALGNSDTIGGGGGGLMGSIVPYAKAIALTVQNEGSEIASAWSVKMLYDKIENVDVSGQLTSYLTKQEARTLYQPVGNYLTAHQDISGKADRSELLGYLPLTGGTLTGNLNLGGNTLFAEAVSLTNETDNWNFKRGDNKLRFLSCTKPAAVGAPGMYWSGISAITSYTGFQLATFGGNGERTLYFRTVWDTSNWSDWYKIYHQGFKPNKSDVGLGSVDNTADANKSVLYATTAGSANNADTVDGYHEYSFFRDLGWWAESDSSHNANDIKNNGAVFAYSSTHSNVPTVGTLVTFVGGDSRYAWQMQRKYNERALFVRSSNGDNGTWLQWEKLAYFGDIDWVNVSSKPTTLSGYGITDGVYAAHVNEMHTTLDWIESTIKGHRHALIYNSNGAEFSYLINFRDDKQKNDNGVVLKWGYTDTYLRIIRRIGTWLSKDWEKISAGYADSAGKLSSSAGSLTQPVYFKDGIPTQTTYSLGAFVLSYTGSLASSGWETIGGFKSSIVSVAYNNAPAPWNSGTYSSSIVFGAGDTKGMLDCHYYNPVVSFGGSSAASATKDSPRWYFKLKGTSQCDYTFPTSSKTLAANDGSNAVGTWGIGISGNAATATRLQTARTIWGQSFDGTDNIRGAFACDSVRIGRGTEIWCDNNLYLNHGATTKANVFICTGGGGNVGIGTTSPLRKFHVAGTSMFTDDMLLESSDFKTFRISRTKVGNASLGVNSNGLYIYSNVAGVGEGEMNFKGGVGLGIDCTPQYKLHVNGDMATTGRAIVGSIVIGDITISYDKANKGLRIAGGGLYTDSYLSSLGVDASTALAVKKWADSIQITTESDAELATAYSIGNLYRLINSNQKSITQSLNQSVSVLQGRCTSLEQRVSALEKKVNK